MTTPLYFDIHWARVAQTRILECGALLFGQNLLKIYISHILPLEKAAEAHRLVETGHTIGKIVLQVA